MSQVHLVCKFSHGITTSFIDTHNGGVLTRIGTAYAEAVDMVGELPVAALLYTSRSQLGTPVSKHLLAAWSFRAAGYTIDNSMVLAS